VETFKRAFLARKLDRVAAAYAVAGWSLVQGASIVLPTFGAPAWVLKVFIVLVISGFPLAIWLAWHAAPHAHYSRKTGSAPTYTDVALLALLAIVILLSLAQVAFEIDLVPWAKRSSTIQTLNSAASANLSPQSPPASIAVLPFVNMSGDPGKEYFSDGVSEELLNDLANAPNLRVAARTSSFAFKGRSEDVRTIARALNVSTVMEGSVREDGEEVRITAQLVSATNGYHIWSKTYDRNLGNILEVQDQIAREITSALTHKLLGTGPGKNAGRPGSINPDTYRKYLEARSLSAKKTDESDAAAIALLKQVTSEQPDFAAAFAALGRTYGHWAEFHHERSDLVSSADLALDQAIRLDPNNLEALFSQLVLALAKWDWQKAARDARTMWSINPHSVFTLRGLSFFYGSFAYPIQQVASLKEAIKLDPLSFVDRNNLASQYNYLGQFRDAAGSASAALALRPDRPLYLYTLCWAYAGLGRDGDAREIANRLVAADEPGAADACSLRIAAGIGRARQAHELADRIAGRFPVFVFDETDIADFYVAAGDIDRAMSWFEKAYDARDGDLFASQELPALPRALFDSPRWTALMQRPEAQKWRAVRTALATHLPTP
jgi:TolB-like protein